MSTTDSPLSSSLSKNNSVSSPVLKSPSSSTSLRLCPTCHRSGSVGFGLKRNNSRVHIHAACSHEGFCLINSLHGFVRNLLAGVGIKLLIKLLTSLATRRKPNFKRFFDDDVRFGVFMGGFAGAYKGINCLLRKLLEEENKLNSFVAGMFAGLSILVLKQESRTPIALYLLVKALAMICQHVASKDQVFPINLRLSSPGVITVCLSASQILYSYLITPSALPKNYLKFLNAAGSDNPYITHLSLISLVSLISHL